MIPFCGGSRGKQFICTSLRWLTTISAFLVYLFYLEPNVFNLILTSQQRLLMLSAFLAVLYCLPPDLSSSDQILSWTLISDQILTRNTSYLIYCLLYSI